MKKLLLLISIFFFLGCEKEEEVVLEQVFEITLDGDTFDPYERYAKVNSFAGSKYVDGVIKKIFILYLQIDDGEVRLDRQRFALYCLDSDANDDGELLDVGTYTWENPDNKYAGVEIPGDQEYVVWNEVIVQDAGQLGGPHSGLICLTAEGEFYNPYVQRTMTVSMRLENFPIGQDVESTPVSYTHL
ncbi:MAG: hypothetical protein MPK62_15140, partial [Alphaproteobacteria bacterium]|nr:hypothetical protein [Alphaproteobacteria bacterium]